MKVKIIILLLAFFLLPVGAFSEPDPEVGEPEEVEETEEVEEGAISVYPAVVEEVLDKRTSNTFTVTVKNETDSSIRFYPLVYDIFPDEGRVDETDREQALSSWIEVDRSRRSLGSGEEKEISITINVDGNAEAGRYSGVVAFSLGSTRPDAAENAETLVQPEVLINLEVLDRIVERAQVLSFNNSNRVLPPASLDLKVENIGNTEVIPTGIIAIYDQRGREIDTLNLNEDRKAIEDGETEIFTGKWGEGFGRYKAVLMAEYGRETERELLDVIFFWVIPWQILVIFGLGIVAFIVLLWLMRKMKM